MYKSNRKCVETGYEIYWTN